jgi:hypothetical protein
MARGKPHFLFPSLEPGTPHKEAISQLEPYFTMLLLVPAVKHSASNGVLRET